MSIAVAGLTLPLGWSACAPDADSDTWIDGVVSSVPRPARLDRSLRTDLGRCVEQMRRPGRHVVAALHPDPALASRVLAAGWVAAGPARDIHEVATLLRGADPPPSVLSRSVEVDQSRRAPAVVCLDLMTDPTASGGSVLHERCAVVVLHRSIDMCVRLELSTSDLTAFDDIAGACLEVARRVRPVAEGDVT